MNTILYAHTGSGNHGCEALVRSTAKMLGGMPILYTTGRAEDLQYGIDQVAEVCEDVIDAVPRRSATYYAAAIHQKMTGQTILFTNHSRKVFLGHVRKGDLCLSIGGDNYCYAGTEILGDLNTLLRKKGAKTVLWGCSIDPEAITPAMAADLKNYDLITVREPLTEMALAQAGVTENVRRVVDPAFLLDVQETQLPAGFIPGNTVGLNISPLIFNYTENKETALEGFYALVKHILQTTDSVVALIPHVVKRGNSDLDVLEPIYEKYKDSGRVLLIPDQNCMQLKHLISQCRLVIGARTHATIAAYSTGIPTLVVGYSVKSRGIAMDLFGTNERYVLPIQQLREPEELIGAYHWLEDNADNIRMRLQEVIPVCKEKARQGKVYLDELIRK